MELVQLSPNRPVTVIDPVDGWRAFVSVHDAYYLRTLSRFRARLSASHADHGHHDRYRFKFALGAYRKWKSREQDWYARVGLTPPRSPGAYVPPAPKRSVGRPRTTSTSILQLISTGEQSARALGQHMGLRANAVGVLIHRLRRRGVPIRSARNAAGEWVYRLEARDAA